MERIELYSNEDFNRVRAERKKRMILFLAMCALTLFFLVFTLILRIEIPGLVVTALLACAGYFFFSMKVLPYNLYCRFLRDMNEGLTRDTEGRFFSISEEIRTVDGVEVNDFVLHVEGGETEERLFLWDVDKPRPEIPEGQTIRITSHSNFIVAIDPL